MSENQAVMPIKVNEWESGGYAYLITHECN